MEIEVIVRCHRGMPARLSVVGATKKLVYLSPPDLVEAIKSGLTGAIGYPIEDVFLFNSEAYERLSKQWDSSGVTANETWRSLEGFGEYAGRLD